MKPMVLDGSACRRIPSRVASILVPALLVFLPCFSLTLFNSCSLAADEESHKAIRRTSSDTGAAIKDQRRVALVIGNSDYKVGPLRNPAHDAEDFSGVLRTLGFAVQTKTNVNQREMEEAVNKFVQEIQNGDVALFYFSGHGVQVRGENYLIPLGDSITSEADVRFKTVNAGLVLAKMEESRNRANIVILDACRNNPFKGLFRSPSMGLSKMDAPKGTFIAYATSPDSVAADGAERNSPYTKHLMEALKVKDIPIEQAFKLVARAVNKETGGQQTPWILSSLLDDFYCNPSYESSLPGTEPARMTVSPGSEPPDYKAQIEREKRESEQEIAKLREARRVAALERERFEREKQEMQREVDRQKQQQRERVASLPAPTPPKPPVSGDAEVAKFQRLAEQGNADAQLRLGNKYRYGLGVPVDYEEAVKWIRKAAEQGNAQASFSLAWLYRNGVGVPENRAEAVKWVKKAADQGNEDAKKELHSLGATSLLAPTPTRPPTSSNAEVVKFQRLAEQGNADAQLRLGNKYRYGLGVPVDYEEAVKWLRKAAEQGNAQASFSLAWLYRNGVGVPENRAEAVKWFQNAADQGNEDAKKELRNLDATSSR